MYIYIYIKYLSIYLSFTPSIYLVGDIPTPLKNMTSSVGMMAFPAEWKNKNVPNHQPYLYIYMCVCASGYITNMAEDHA